MLPVIFLSSRSLLPVTLTDKVKIGIPYSDEAFPHVISLFLILATASNSDSSV